GNDVISIKNLNSGPEYLAKYEVTRNGQVTQYDYKLVGGINDIVILGLAGDDQITVDQTAPVPGYIKAGAGSDTIHGGSAIFGDAGNDTIDGGVFTNVIDGGAGDDIIDAGDGDDTVRGGKGNDIIHGGAGDDELIGDAGNDQIYSDTGHDQVAGG